MCHTVISKFITSADIIDMLENGKKPKTRNVFKKTGITRREALRLLLGSTAFIGTTGSHLLNPPQSPAQSATRPKIPDRKIESRVFIPKTQKLEKASDEDLKNLSELFRTQVQIAVLETVYEDKSITNGSGIYLPEFGIVLTSTHLLTLEGFLKTPKLLKNAISTVYIPKTNQSHDFKGVSRPGLTAGNLDIGIALVQPEKYDQALQFLSEFSARLPTRMQQLKLSAHPDFMTNQVAHAFTMRTDVSDFEGPYTKDVNQIQLWALQGRFSLDPKVEDAGYWEEVESKSNPSRLNLLLQSTENMMYESPNSLVVGHSAQIYYTPNTVDEEGNYFNSTPIGSSGSLIVFDTESEQLKSIKQSLGIDPNLIFLGLISHGFMIQSKVGTMEELYEIISKESPNSNFIRTTLYELVDKIYPDHRFTDQEYEKIILELAKDDFLAGFTPLTREDFSMVVETLKKSIGMNS